MTVSSSAGRLCETAALDIPSDITWFLCDFPLQFSEHCASAQVEMVDEDLFL